MDLYEVFDITKLNPIEYKKAKRIFTQIGSDILILLKYTKKI